MVVVGVVGEETETGPHCHVATVHENKFEKPYREVAGG